MSTSTDKLAIIARIRELLGPEAVLLPVTPATKKCPVKGWQKITADQARQSTHEAKLVTSNIAVSLGARSDGLCSIDFDDDQAAETFLEANPTLAASLRTKGARGMNIWVRIRGPYPAAGPLRKADGDGHVGEWRATGNYTVIHGIHPSGCSYQRLIDAPPIEVEFSQIRWPHGIQPPNEIRTVEPRSGRPLPEVLLENRRSIAESLLANVTWEGDHGYCDCPGKEKHTSADGPKDCAIYLDGIPTLHCVHQSCADAVGKANASLREQVINREVVIIPDGYNTIEDAAKLLFETLKATKRFYVSAGKVAEIADGPQGPVIEQLTSTRAVATWEKFTRFGSKSVKDGETKIRLQRLDEPTARLFLESDERNLLPPLHAITTCPILFEDVIGQLCVHNHGYNPHTATYVANPRGSTPLPHVPLDEAVEALKGLIADFNFENPSHRSRALMSFITPALVFSGLLGGRAPLEITEADSSQAGKGFRQKLVCALYGEHPTIVAQRRGGVGSLDESVQQALLGGRPFIALDNIRGSLDSPYLESLLTAPKTMDVRGFGRAAVSVNVTKIIPFLSSNQLEMTVDLANRSSIVRILKQPDGYQWRRFGPKQLFVDAWLAENQPYYLACVYAIVRAWHHQGCPELSAVDHDFRWWAGKGEWIIQNLLKEASMLEGYRHTQRRASDSLLAWLQELARQAERLGKLESPLQTHELVTLSNHAGIGVYRTPGKKGQHFNDDLAELRYLGGVLATAFTRDEMVRLEGYIVRRQDGVAERTNGFGTYRVKTYTFARTNGAHSPSASAPPTPTGAPWLDAEPSISFGVPQNLHEPAA